MGKKLEEMTKEELWQLFPIFLTEHQDCWKTYYEEEKALLISLLSNYLTIEHIGSTAINGIWAKAIVDLLVEFANEDDLMSAKAILCQNGYRCMSESAGRISLNKGYTEDGFAQKVFHIHLRLKGDNDEIIFRDYLNGHPQCAKDYEMLKLSLWKQYEHNRDGYTDAKTDFIVNIVQQAKKEMLSLRPLTDEDLPIIENWMHQPHVSPWFTHPDAWINEIKKRDNEFNFITHYIVMLKERPIGFAQYYDYSKSGEDWQGTIPIDGSISLDYLIGEADCISRGYGKLLIGKLIDEIAKHPQAKRIIVQPEKENSRSRATLTAAGFQFDDANDVYLIQL